MEEEAGMYGPSCAAFEVASISEETMRLLRIQGRAGGLDTVSGTMSKAPRPALFDWSNASQRHYFRRQHDG
jgi:hypothetical protein